MNEQTPRLPELSAESIARIEADVFDRISEESAPRATSRRSSSRRRAWLTGAGVAAAFVVGVMVTPPLLLGSLNISSEAGSASRPQSNVAEVGSAEHSVTDSAIDAGATTAVADAVREVITSASVSLQVDSVDVARSAVEELAAQHGGYVESSQMGGADTYSSPETTTEESTYGWLTLRVPSANLTAVIDALGDHGVVLSSSLSGQDVTSEATDLRARIGALEASVTRLTELMSQSGSVSELIEAEVALTERQAELDSYRQQLAALDNQVAMSTLQVDFSLKDSATDADPGGFGQGLLAGWNGLVASLNALIIVLGFVLPWLVVAGVVVVVVTAIRASIRRKRERARGQAE